MFKTIKKLSYHSKKLNILKEKGGFYGVFGLTRVQKPMTGGKLWEQHIAQTDDLVLLK